MSVDYHRHCQATVLSANGTGDQNGNTWSVLSNLNSTLTDLPTGWIDKFKPNRLNITEDFGSILKILNDSYFKNSGGNLTGSIVLTNPSGSELELAIKRGTSNKRVFICSGTNFSDGAYMALAGKGYVASETPKQGMFQLGAKDGTNTSVLIGKPNGQLTWKDKNLVRSVNGTSADSNGNVTVDISSMATQAWANGRFLPLAGGTMTGPITLDSTIEYIIKSNKSKRVFIQAGNDFDQEDGAGIVLAGNGYTGSSPVAGGFYVSARKSESEKATLEGKPNGTLKWKDKNIVRSIKVATDNGSNASGHANTKLLLANENGEVGNGYTIASVDWVKKFFVGGEALNALGIDGIQQIVNMLLSMLQKQSITYYVNENSGNDETNTGSSDSPFKTIHKAIEKANERRFVQDASLTIKLQSDITLGTGTLQIYHPDLIQNKYCYIQSADANQKTISFTNTDYTELTVRTRYSSVITLYCNTYFTNIKFKGDFAEGEGSDDMWTRLQNFATHRVYSISNASSSNRIVFYNCEFEYCNTCMTGANFNLENSTFNVCGEIGDIGTGPRTDITNTLTVTNCFHGLNLSSGTLRWQTNDSGTMTLTNVGNFLTVSKGSNFQLAFQYSAGKKTDAAASKKRIKIESIRNKYDVNNDSYNPDFPTGKRNTEPWTLKNVAQLLVGDGVTVASVDENTGVVNFNNPAVDKTCIMYFDTKNSPNDLPAAIAQNFARLFEKWFKFGTASAANPNN